MTKASTQRPRRPAAEHAASAVPEEAAVRVLRQFRQIFNAVKAHFQRLEKTSGLGGAQIWALSVIKDRPGIGVTELAAAMDIRQSTASNLVRSLTERELVEPMRHPVDGRAVQLAILPKGKRLIKGAPGPLVGVLPDALAMLDQATLARLEGDLAALLALLNPEESSAQVPLADL